jgi:enediyne biosynthesis protein E4
VAWLDYDQDGLMDLFLVQSAAILYHNNGDGTFTDVTSKAGQRPRELVNQRGLVRL